MDKHFRDLSPNESYFILNHTRLLDINGAGGTNFGKGKPRPANYAKCELNQPAGETYVVGGYRSPFTKEVFSWHLNSNGVHYILRTTNERCQIVYFDNCLELSAEPKNSIEDFRAFLAVEKVCHNRDGKQLIWTNGIGDIHQIDVEASIATNSFTTPFFQRCADDCALIRMAVPEPCGCLKGEFVPITDAERSLNNFILDKPFQFIYQHVYYDGREGEWSDPSSTYYLLDGGCGDSAARCIKLRIPVGNPLVEKIRIGFSNGQDIWYLYDTVDKYKKYNDSQEKWYQRELAELTNYDDVDCAFDYYFCNDRQKVQIDPADIRVYNPAPRDAQGFINIKEALGFFNYVQGVCPVDKKEIEKIDIGINCTTQNCVTEFATVKVRAVIYALSQGGNGFVFRNGTANAPDDPEEEALFGSRSLDDANTYGQKFVDKTRNFIVYMEGTDYWAEMKQWVASTGFINRTERGVVAVENSGDVDNYQTDLANQGKYFYQEAIFKVPKGTKGILRLASHKATSGIGANQNTSTTVGAIFNIPNFVNGSLSVPTADTKRHEILFDTCSGDADLMEAFLIYDQSEFGNTGRANTGYVKDDNTNPVEGIDVQLVLSGSPVASLDITDHNGFYHFTIGNSNPYAVALFGEQDCDDFEIMATADNDAVAATLGTSRQVDFTLSLGNYKDDFFAKVLVPVKDCNGNGISGVRVAITGSKYKVTDADGIAEFHLRNYTTRDRYVTAFPLNVNGCFTKDCAGGCNPCMPSVSALLTACFSGKPSQTIGTILISNATSQTEVRGLKSGGRYEFAVMFKGNNRISAAYPIKFIDVPSTQQKGYLGFCDFSFNAAANPVIPDWATCMHILRSKNLNQYELQWRVDKFERTAEGKLKLTIQSLNDYNSRYLFKTNTTYQWVKGDRVEFIFNGDGSVFNTSTNDGRLNYLAISPFHDELISGETEAPADFFNQLLINDDGRLDNLTEGAIIELQRPTPVESDKIYHSICAVVPVVNGRLSILSGIFETFDTYLVNRLIQTTSGSFANVYEHHSPSDFWGERVSDAGKRYVANEFENERRFGRNISFNAVTNYSRFGELVKTVDCPEHGDLIAATINDGRIILFISENDNSMAQAADDLVRLGSDNVIRAVPGDAVISSTQPKLYGKYGCQYDDIGSVYFGDGYATWVDADKKIMAHHDYNVARNASLGKTETYFRIRCLQKQFHNKNVTDPLDKFRWANGMNWISGEWYLTLKTLRHDSIYNEFAPFKKDNDTIIYHPDSKEYLGFAGWTPEFYSQLDTEDEDGCAFISFSKGVPYIHPVRSDLFNQFYGITVDEIFWVTLNAAKNKVMRPMAIEIKSEMRWYAKEVTTSKKNFLSEIPAAMFKRENEKWSSGFLFNKNSRAGLHGNSSVAVEDDTRGEYINVALIRDNTIGLQYGTIDHAKRVMYNETGDVIMKFAVVEQVGLTENV